MRYIDERDWLIPSPRNVLVFEKTMNFGKQPFFPLFFKKILVGNHVRREVSLSSPKKQTQRCLLKTTGCYAKTWCLYFVSHSFLRRSTSLKVGSPRKMGLCPYEPADQHQSTIVVAEFGKCACSFHNRCELVGEVGGLQNCLDINISPFHMPSYA